MNHEALPTAEDEAWTLAARVRVTLDMEACPEKWMSLAVEAIVAEFPRKTWPIGTNLFTATEARAMLEYVVGTAPTAERPQVEPLMQYTLRKMGAQLQTDAQHFDGEARSYIESIGRAISGLAALAAPHAAGQASAVRELVAKWRGEAAKVAAMYPNCNRIGQLGVAAVSDMLSKHADELERALADAAPACAKHPSEGDAQFWGLWDSQWVNIVNHADCYRDFTKEEAVAQAVKLTYAALRENNIRSAPPVAAEAVALVPAEAKPREPGALSFGGVLAPTDWTIASSDWSVRVVDERMAYGWNQCREAMLERIAHPPASVSKGVKTLPFTDATIDKMQDVMAVHGFAVPVRVISDAFLTTWFAKGQAEDAEESSNGR